MGASENGTVKIRRSWTEELVQLALGFVIAMIAIFGFDKHALAYLYVPWTLVFLHMNRQQGIDLMPTTAVVRTLFWKSRTVRRDEITDVTIIKIGAGSFIALHVADAKRPVKLTVKTAFGPFGKQRIAEAYAQIQQWRLQAPAVPAREPAQMPGSASI